MTMQSEAPQFGRRDRAPGAMLEYVPKPGLGGLAIKNFLLKIITLGIYSFWAKTNVRRHIWSCVRFMGEPLGYTGTGKELFLGMLVVVGIVILPLTVVPLIIQLNLPPGHYVSIAAQIIPGILLVYLIGVGIYRARRYRLSRTLWRGIRGTLTGSPWRFAWRNFWMTLLLPITLLWSYPWMSMKLTSHIMNDTEFGSGSFQFAGPVAPLYKRFAVLWFGIVILFGLFSLVGFLSDSTAKTPDTSDIFLGMSPESMGIILVILFVVGLPAILLLFSMFFANYMAGELNHFAKCTGFENLQIGMNATTFSLIGLSVGNFFILLLSLGIAMPFVQQRLIRYMCDRLTVTGALDVASLQQSQATVDKRGEGLAEVFDIDAF